MRKQSHAFASEISVPILHIGRQQETRHKGEGNDPSVGIGEVDVHAEEELPSVLEDAADPQKLTSALSKSIFNIGQPKTEYWGRFEQLLIWVGSIDLPGISKYSQRFPNISDEC